MRDDSLPLLRWSPTSKFIPFPMAYRVGRIRQVASKLLRKTTERQTEHYRKQVTEGIYWNLKRLGISDEEIGKLVSDFWEAVDREVLRQSYSRVLGPGGAK